MYTYMIVYKYHPFSLFCIQMLFLLFMYTYMYIIVYKYHPYILHFAFRVCCTLSFFLHFAIYLITQI